MKSTTNTLLFLFVLIASSCSEEEEWAGRWFPAKETSTFSPIESTSTTNNDTWSGKWFPFEPPKSGSHPSSERDRIMGVPNSDCDDGETNLLMDFDPHNVRHSLSYICLEPTYKPSYKVEPVLTLYDVPKFYTPVHKCMNETIVYDHRIPTLGYHRPLWAAYGEYTYLPPQRWLHNLEHGAIVALYHPCANKNQVNKLKALTRSCLFRHIITPYNLLSEDKPFALVAWGASLEFSVIDNRALVDFVKKYAKTGPEKVNRDGQYKQLLIKAADIVTDADDYALCPNVKIA